MPNVTCNDYTIIGYDGNARLNDMWSISLATTLASGPVSPGADATSLTASAPTQRVWEEVHFFGESPPTCCEICLIVSFVQTLNLKVQKTNHNSRDVPTIAKHPTE
jgi:hypothetical protein